MPERHCAACGAVFGDDVLFCGMCGALLSEDGHGPILGGYEILERIAAGGMGVVHRARRLADDAIVAVKLMKRAEDARALLRFAREANTLKRLRHPGIVRLMDVLSHPKTPGLVMELLRGCTLKELLHARKQLALAEAVWVGLRVLDALGYAHDQGVVHRDLKPSNVFLTDEGGLKLLDFGLAKGIEDRDLTQTGMALGAFLYTPPEQVRGERPQPATDLYAFGCVLFEMIAGRPPFLPSAGGDFALMEMHLHTPPPRLDAFAPDAPAALVELVDGLLRKDPQARPTLAQTRTTLATLAPAPTPPALPAGAARYSDLISDKQSDAHTAPTRTQRLAPHTLYWAISEFLHAPAPPEKLLLAPPDLSETTLARARRWISCIPKPPQALISIWKDACADASPSAQALATALQESPPLQEAAQRLARAWQAAELPLPVAIARIGAFRVMDFLLVQALVPPTPPARARAMRGLALHLLGIATIARALAVSSAAVAEALAGALGLAHDIGKLALVAATDDAAWEDFCMRIAQKPALAAEWEAFGCSHLDVGMLAAVAIDAPQPVRRWLFYHHHPEGTPPSAWPVEAQPLLMLLHTSHLVLQAMMKDTQELPEVLKASPWSQAMRPLRADHERLLRHPLALPLADERLYASLVEETARVLQRANEALRL